jgi:beta-glucosidase
MVNKPYFRTTWISCMLFCGICFSATAQDTLAFLNPSLPIDTRIQDLLHRMTLQEKVSQMQNASPAIPRLHIPAYNWWSEALHGVARSGVATVFPEPIGLAASFDDSLEYEIATAISDEARAMYNAAAARNRYEQYGGLTFWTPNINIFRDPRWGRGQETYGEDPYLTGRMATAFIRGMQGNDPRYVKTAACAKHFVVHSGPEGLRHEFDARASLHDLYDTYLPAFHAAVKAGVEAVMCAYNSTNGEPCCANTYLLDTVLRKDWGFRGHVVSDCGAINDIYAGHHYVKSEAAAAAIAVKRGVNLDCGNEYALIPEAIQQGLLTEADVDSALVPLLRTRFKLGLFDPPAYNPYNAIPPTVINSEAHRLLARRAAEESIVMLKNDGVLPLRKDLAKYFVTGPNATNLDVLLGNYYGVNPRMVTILEGIAGAVAPGSQVQYKPGCLLAWPNANPIDWTTGDAHSADVTIVVLGLSGLLEGEEGDAIASPDRGDRATYDLPANQIEFLRKLRAHNTKPIIAVITGGSPVNLAPVDSLADAVLMVWYPGEEGGNAIANVIFGKTSPSGKLPVSFPMSYSQLPPFDDYSMQGRTYRYMTATPMYPFGYGLTYGKFEFHDGSLQQQDSSLLIRVQVSNTGKYTSADVVQLYVTPPQGKTSFPVPRYALKGFQRIWLKPGDTQEVYFQLPLSALQVVNAEGKKVWLKGSYEIAVGESLPDARSQQLGMAVPVKLNYVLK